MFHFNHIQKTATLPPCALIHLHKSYSDNISLEPMCWASFIIIGLKMWREECSLGLFFNGPESLSNLAQISLEKMFEASFIIIIMIMIGQTIEF